MNRSPRKDQEDAFFDALAAAEDRSFVDALLAVPQADEGTRDILADALQSALAARMRALLERRRRDEAA